MLVDHADAQRVRIVRRMDRALAPVHGNLPRSRFIEADQAFHQRAFSGTVLAQQRMERPGFDMHRYVVERGERAEALGHAGHLHVERMVEHDLVLGLHAHHLIFGHQALALIASIMAVESATAPNTPPCIVTIFSAARWLP